MNDYPVTGSPPTLDPTLCLNERYRGAGCIRCVTTCPTVAIQLRGGRPQIEESMCAACGACIQACPTGALESSGWTPEAALFLAMSDRPSGSVGMACVQAASNATLPVAVLGRSARCLAALSISELLSLALAGEEVWLDDTPCASCSIGAARTTIHRTTRTANALLAGADTNTRIRLGTAQVQKVDAFPEVIDGKRLSRRALFSAIKRRAADATRGPNFSHQEGATKLPHRVPRSRRDLLRTISQLKPVHRVDATDLPFAAVLVDGEACSACNLCATLCPTDALVFLSDVDSFTLAFQPSTCLDCGICAAVCPEGAITYGPDLSLSSLSAPSRWLMTDGPLVPCRQCETPTASHGEEQPVCWVCRSSAGAVRPLHDGAGLMEDLPGTPDE